MAYLRLRSARAGASGMANLIDFLRSYLFFLVDGIDMEDFDIGGVDFISLFSTLP